MPRTKSMSVLSMSSHLTRNLNCAGLFFAVCLASASAEAACVFAPGPLATAGDDVVTCDNSGSDPAGISTLAGNDSLNVLVGSAINGLVDMGTGVATVTNAGLIDSSQEAMLIFGNGTMNNTSTGVINFGDAAMLGGVGFVGQPSVAAVDIDNSGRIESDDGIVARYGIGVRSFTAGSIDINNNLGATLSVGEAGTSTVIGTDDAVAAVFVVDVGTADVTVVNDGAININTSLSATTINTNTYGVTIQDADGPVATNNGTLNVTANLEETNTFGMISIQGSNSTLTNTGSIAVTGTSTYTGVPANEEPDLIGMLSLFEAGTISVTNTSGATISLLSDSSSSLGVISGMGAAVCFGGGGCAGTSVSNAGAINVTVNSGTDNLAAGIVAVADFTRMMVDNSGSITTTNTAPGSAFAAGLFTSDTASSVYTNSGSINVQELSNSTPAAGIAMQGASEPSVTNSVTGTIAATGAISHGMVIAQSGSALALASANFSNAGTISGNTGLLINGSAAINAAINHYFDNSGTISGTGGIAIDAVTDVGILTDTMDNPVPTGVTVETVENSGSIMGDVNLGQGDDTVLQSASSAMISGDIDFGPGDDVGQWSGGSMQNLSGGTGSETVTVSSGEYDGTQMLDGGDDAAAGDGWVDVLTVQGATIETTSANLSNWETIILDNSVFSFSDNALTVGADPSTGLSLTNGAALSLQDGSADDDFALNGNLGGDGVLQIDTVLGDSGSATDTLSISGDVSGVTTLNITNAGGPGNATTGNGILIVQVAGTSPAGGFILPGGELRAGDYVYSLAQVGADWYLQSDLDPIGPGPGPGPGPTPIDGSARSIPSMTAYSLLLLSILLCVVGARGVTIRSAKR